jgi:hypothetical protein
VMRSESGYCGETTKLVVRKSDWERNHNSRTSLIDRSESLALSKWMCSSDVMKCGGKSALPVYRENGIMSQNSKIHVHSFFTKQVSNWFFLSVFSLGGRVDRSLMRSLTVRCRSVRIM